MELMITLHLTRVVKYDYETCQTWMRSEGLSNDNMYHEQSLSRKEHAATAKGAISRTRIYGAGWKHPPDLFELGSFTASGCLRSNHIETHPAPWERALQRYEATQVKEVLTCFV